MKKLIFPGEFISILLIIGFLSYRFPEQANVLIYNFNTIFVAACLVGLVIYTVQVVRSYYKNVVCAK